MIKDKKIWQKFEAEFTRNENLTIEQKFKILEAMLEEAKSLGVWPPKDPLEGIEVDIKLAKAINAIQRTPRENSK